MTTFRVARRTRFTTVDRATTNDRTLSFRARGVLIWLLDKPNDWRCDSDAIAAAGTEGRDAIRAALRELERAGYLRREKVQDPETGRWATLTTVYERPPDDGFPVVGNPGVGDPGVGRPVAKNRDCGTKTETENTPADAEVVKVAQEVASAYWEWIRTRTGKPPTGIKFLALRSLIKPFLVAGYDVAAVKLALATMYDNARPFTAQVIEQHLDGRAGRPKQGSFGATFDALHDLIADEEHGDVAADGTVEP